MGIAGHTNRIAAWAPGQWLGAFFVFWATAASGAPKPRGDSDEGFRWEGGSAPRTEGGNPGWDPILWAFAFAIGLHALLVVFAVLIVKIKDRTERAIGTLAEEATAQLLDFGHAIGTFVIFILAAMLVPMLAIGSGGSTEVFLLIGAAIFLWRLRSYVLTLEHWIAHGVGTER